MITDRLQQLTEFVAQHPEDAFARYGLAMETMRGGDGEGALVEFGRLRERHPDYAAAYQQAGQLLLSLDRRAEAAALLRDGIAAAQRQGNAHAAGEMQGLLDEAAG